MTEKTGNVVYGSFGRPKGPDAASDTGPGRERVIQSKEWFASGKSGESETASQTPALLSLFVLVMRIRLHLQSLRGNITRETIALHTDTLTTLTLEEIQELIGSSTELQWSAKPAFYTAVVDEVSKRVRDFEG